MSKSASTLATPPSPAAIRPRVLFVDDEPLLTRLGEEFLKRLGYDVVTTTSPTEAVDLFTNGCFEVVITDLTMPGMSGMELAEALKRIRPSVPLILTTAFHQKLEGRNPAEFGFCALLLKPYNLKALDQVLRAALPAETPGT